MKLKELYSIAQNNVWVVLFAIIFLLGIFFVIWLGNSKTKSGISPAPKPEPVHVEDIAELDNGEFKTSSEQIPESKNEDEELSIQETQESCPTLLIKRGNKLMLFNKNMPEIQGENPIFFDNLDQYTNYVETQRKLYNEECPILFLQEENNAQGENVYKLRKTVGTSVDPLLMSSVQDYFQSNTNVVPQFAPPTAPTSFNKIPANYPLVDVAKKEKPLVPYKDANRDDKPYNQVYHGFDPSNQYVGRYTVLDKIHDSTKYQNKSGKSDNPMDPNWGGVVFTEEKVKAGEFQENNVQPPTKVDTFGTYSAKE